MKTRIFIALLFIFEIQLSLVYCQNGEELPFQKWAITPPMGWNSWDCFGPSVKENEVKANADYMAANLKQYGWEYVVVDIRWYVDNQTTGTYNAFNNSTFVYDAYGRYMPSPARFPSSVGGLGFKPLADYIHAKGLKFGIHIMRGVPKVAVSRNLPIKNSTRTANQIYSTASECTWLHDNYTIDASKQGAQEYYNSIFELYALWEVDFVKIDDLSRPYHEAEINLIRNAIDSCGRPMVLSMSPGETPVEKYGHVCTHANMWRTVDDFWDNWSQLNYQFSVCNKWSPYIAAGTFPDADMLPLGHIAIRGERGSNRQTNFTQDEQYTLMTLWTIFRSPLMFGGHLPDNNAFTNSLLTNAEVLTMHKTSINNRQFFNKNDQIAWIADDPFDGSKYLALFNNGGDGFISTQNLLYRSGTISRLTDGYGVDIDVEIPKNSTELYIVVNDGGDNFDCDHADWLNPKLYKQNGDSILLTSLNWEFASAGWGTVAKNRSISGGTLNVAGTNYVNGIGTHARSVIMYQLPDSCVRFRCFAGLDQGGTNQTGGATVEFLVANQDPTLRNVEVSRAIANSGRISRTVHRAGVHLNADITGANKLYLVVTDAGDNFNYDHADWISPAIYNANGDSILLTSLTWVSATSGFGSVQKNKSLDGNPLTVNGVVYSNGLGVNSYSTIKYNLPVGYTTFKSFCGFDDDVLNAPNGVSVEFMVFTENPANTSASPVPFDLTELGFAGETAIHNLWTGNDTTLNAENLFSPSINNHGAGLYKVTANNRSTATEIMFMPILIATDNANTQDFTGGEGNMSFFASVQKTGTDTAAVSGQVVFYQNDSLAGIVNLNEDNHAEYLAANLREGTYIFTAHYSGNASYKPQTSNAVTINIIDYNSNSAETQRNSHIKITETNHKKFITGLKSGDIISVYNLTGQLIYTHTAKSEIEEITHKGVSLIKIRTNNEYFIFKTVL